MSSGIESTKGILCIVTNMSILLDGRFSVYYVYFIVYFLKIVDMFNQNYLSCALLDTMFYIVISSQKESPCDREIQGKVTRSLERLGLRISLVHPTSSILFSKFTIPFSKYMDIKYNGNFCAHITDRTIKEFPCFYIK